MKKRVLLQLHTSMHIGDEQGLGVVDMPIYREKHTGFPIIPASTIKGVIKRDYGNDIGSIFGSEKKEGTVIFYDGRLLLFPIKSLKGLYMLITCPYIMNHYNNENKQYNLEDNEAYVLEGNIGRMKDISNFKSEKIVLEEFIFKVKRFDNNKVLSLSSEFNDTVNKRLVMVSDNTFSHLVQLYTEINTRVSINDKGVVENGPFTQEFIPKEAMFYADIEDLEKKSGQEKDKGAKEELPINLLSKELTNGTYIQIGGNQTLGKGLARCVVINK
ncbi:type III-B CRISPR module RAMP protein Cmr4 [Vallitalea pronyensis]|uniref:Type III-B CRISPR module RAMP protein Cmr4 n=1 Tax=Vallitalea pronyensis TaxID=1348613 RepID=A0A8J8MMH6_9FIRM|nr:type III-B CRISPR module RAMP protein Cmr4 [Vallitalea pronyensis]QUI23988.1 type III-B CRISPR module RAMP protein Cmr4 [Vallitalea pronyensis]